LTLQAANALVSYSFLKRCLLLLPFLLEASPFLRVLQKFLSPSAFGKGALLGADRSPHPHRGYPLPSFSSSALPLDVILRAVPRWNKERPSSVPFFFTFLCGIPIFHALQLSGYGHFRHIPLLRPFAPCFYARLPSLSY